MNSRALWKPLLALLAVGGLLAAGAALFDTRRAPREGPRTVAVSRGRIASKALVVGRLAPVEEIRVKSKLSGIVTRCFAEVGETVAKGDPLFEVAPDPTPLEARDAERDVELARVTLEKARADLARHEALFQAGVLPQSDLDATRERHARARIDYERSVETRDLTLAGRIAREGIAVESIVRAPADGTILARFVNPGDPVVPLTNYQAGTELATLADMSHLVLKGTVDEIDVGKIREGMPARISVGALPDADVRGRLTHIAPQARAEAGGTVFDVEIEITDRGGRFLRAGYSANAEIVIAEKEDALLLPERVVSFEEGLDKPFVRLPPESRGGPPRRLPIVIGLSDGLSVEILSGLSEGQAVLEAAPAGGPARRGH